MCDLPLFPVLFAPSRLLAFASDSFTRIRTFDYWFPER